MKRFPDELMYDICGFMNIKKRKNIVILSRLCKNICERLDLELAKKYYNIWRSKVILSRFPKIQNSNQKIKKMIPILWLLNTALNNETDRGNARDKVGIRLQYKFSTRYIENDDMEVPDYLAEEYVRIQYVYYPNRTIMEFINKIEDKCALTRSSEFRINNLGQNKTLPELLKKLFTKGDLSYYGY